MTHMNLFYEGIGWEFCPKVSRFKDKAEVQKLWVQINNEKRRGEYAFNLQVQNSKSKFAPQGGRSPWSETSSPAPPRVNVLGQTVALVLRIRVFGSTPMCTRAC